jgi:hypothetical protein
MLVTFSSLTLPIPLFWVLAGLYPGFLLVRNQYYRNFYFKAKKNLEESKLVRHSEALLFRCNKSEIKELAKCHTKTQIEEWLKYKKENELRWEVFDKRFFEIKE